MVPLCPAELLFWKTIAFWTSSVPLVSQFEHIVSWFGPLVSLVWTFSESCLDLW